MKLSIFIPEEKKVEGKKEEKNEEEKNRKNEQTKEGKYEGINNEEKTKKEAEETVECQEEEKYLVPLKMKKFSLLMSCRFWLELFFISFYKIHPSEESKTEKENRNKEENKNEKENGDKEENKNEKENGDKEENKNCL